MTHQLISEISIITSRASGPGGQHVNKTESRVELHWNVEESEALNDEEKTWFKERVGKRLTNEGVLILISQNNRSQLRNREDVTQRFLDLVAANIHPPVIRKKTKPSRAAKEKRLQTKKQHSEKKKNRKKDW